MVPLDSLEDLRGGLRRIDSLRDLLESDSVLLQVCAAHLEQALESATDANRFSGGNSKAISLRGYIVAKQGRSHEAREVLKALEAVSRDHFVPPYAMALVHAGLGAMPVSAAMSIKPSST